MTRNLKTTDYKVVVDLFTNFLSSTDRRNRPATLEVAAVKLFSVGSSDWNIRS